MRELLTTKKGSFGGLTPFTSGEEKAEGFIMKIASSFYRGWKGPFGQITLLALDQKIPDWLMKITFLGEVQTAIRSGIKSRFGVIGF